MFECQCIKSAFLLTSLTKVALSFRSFTDQRRQDFFQSCISFQFRERSEGLQCRNRPRTSENQANYPFVTYFPYRPIPVKLNIIKLFAKSGKSLKRHFLFECQCIKSAFLLTSLTKVALSFRSFTDQRRQDFFQSCISFQFRERSEGLQCRNRPRTSENQANYPFVTYFPYRPIPVKLDIIKLFSKSGKSITFNARTITKPFRTLWRHVEV